MKIIVGLALFFSLCGIGNAQTQSSFIDFSERLEEKFTVLNKINANVLQMTQGAISDTDFGVAIKAAQDSQYLYAYATTLFTVSKIYSLMIDDRDIKTVKKAFNFACKITIEKSELTVETINKGLPTIKSTALVNEVTKLRDANISILQTLEFCKTN